MTVYTADELINKYKNKKLNSFIENHNSLTKEAEEITNKIISSGIDRELNAEYIFIGEKIKKNKLDLAEYILNNSDKFKNL